MPQLFFIHAGATRRVALARQRRRGSAMVASMIAIVIVVAAVAGYLAYRRLSIPEVAPNPDPNHTHADVAVWIDGKQLDFSDQQYMSGSSADTATHPTGGLRKFLHLHDGNGHVIHRHKPGFTLRQFFESLGAKFRVQPGGLCIDFPQIDEVCQQEAEHKNWVMIVNGEQSHLRPEYVFKDGDKILIFFEDEPGSTDEKASLYWKEMTDDACRYSRTCPRRGPPPIENCVADPEVPCVIEE